MTVTDEKRKVEINGIEKLRPELLDLSVAELERRRVEIDMAIDHQRRAEEEKRRQADIALAQVAFDNLMDAIHALNGLGRLPDRIRNVLVSEDGSFQPGRYLKKPRS